MLQNQSPQILRSPTRLGLTSPHSPSFSNPTTPKLISQKISAIILPTTTIATASSSLLPLLPPLSRAQSLLLQMASLASKIFQVSPNRASWFTSFRGSLPTFLASQTLTLLLLKKSSRYSLLYKLNSLNQLLSFKKFLIFGMLNRKFLERLKQKMRYTTFAPPEFGAGQAPLRGALPPAPQEEQMRASQLYNFADLDIGLPKIESNEKTIETLVEAPRSAAENNKLGDLAAVQGLLPPHLTIPSGWRPGMPVELPTDFSIIPPAGWKPGDPVPLPLLDAIVLGKVEEQQPHRAPPMPVKGPEPFQVRHVQLDIDQNDSSSEYSSEGSSEED
ncbi:hypothetical protein MKX03_019170 [Papaver bracteatum]|nr:hypothetical protein MKX03_019170 [Papaver bracteatum]